jgi:hypothetical protein
MTDNVIEFGKKPKQATPPAPVHGDMTGYQTARAISHHFGITISNDDAIKLDRALRASVHHAMEQARREEREACAKHFDSLKGSEWFAENVAEEIRARGKQ